MKFTFVAVSVPALKEVLQFQKRYTREYPEQDVEISCFYVAGIRPFQTEKLAVMTKAVEEADVAVIDTMGAPEFLQERMGEALEKCRGHRIVIGNTLREYLCLGSFSMGSMSKMMKKDAPAKTEERPQEKPEKSGKRAIDKMHRMRRMSLMLGNILPFGITKDMKNVFLLVDYWQQATREDITSFFHLLLRQYAGQKFLPKEKPCTMRYGIYLKDPFTLECEERLEKYWKAAGHDSKKDTVALLFYGHSYPNDFLPVVQAVAGKLKERYNILPIAFSQNEDADLEKLRAYVSDSRSPVAAVINLMPFRLGAGRQGAAGICQGERDGHPGTGVCETRQGGHDPVRGQKAELVLPYTKSVDFAAERLKPVKAKGNTPLAMGIRLAIQVQEQDMRKHPEDLHLTVLLTDGKSNYDVEPGKVLDLTMQAAGEMQKKELPLLVVDTENSIFGMGIARKLADAAGGTYAALT